MKTSDKTILFFAVQAVLLLVGCASLPTRLSDPDKSVHDSAFNEVLISSNFSAKNAKLAVDAINNPKELDKLATEANSSWIRMNAAERVSNPSLARSIVLNEKERRYVRIAALEGMSDPKALQTIIMKVSDIEIQSNAVRRINSEKILSQIAVANIRKEIRIAAAERISDKDTLKGLFLKARDWEVFNRIAARINDSAIRSEYDSTVKWRKTAQCDTRWRARLEAVNHLQSGRDDDVLLELSLYDGRAEVRQAAIARIDNQEFLKLVYKDNGGVFVPKWKTMFPAGKPRNVFELQREMQQEIKEELELRSSAEKNLEEEYRTKIFRLNFGFDKPQFDLLNKPEHRFESDRHADSRAALIRITDHAFLTAVLKENSAYVWNIGAFWTIRDRLGEQELIELALAGTNDSCVNDYIEKIQDQTVLAKIAQQQNHRGREAAIKRLTDQTVLSELAQLDNDNDIRSAAGNRLVDLTCESKDSNFVLRAARGEFGRDSQLKILSMPNVSKEVYEIAFKGFLNRSGGSGVDINEDEELIKKCPYDDLVQWVASYKIGDGDRGYWNQRHAKEELVRRGLYPKEKFNDENFKHDAVRDALFGM